MNRLFIDTSSNQKIVVSLEKGEESFEKSSEQEVGSQALLKLIDSLLKESGVDKKDLSEIEVVTGPGSFTGLRVGVSVANALGMPLGIKVNGKDMETEIRYQ